MSAYEELINMHADGDFRDENFGSTRSLAALEEIYYIRAKQAHTTLLFNELIELCT